MKTLQPHFSVKRQFSPETFDHLFDFVTSHWFGNRGATRTYNNSFSKSKQYVHFTIDTFTRSRNRYPAILLHAHDLFKMVIETEINPLRKALYFKLVPYNVQVHNEQIVERDRRGNTTDANRVLDRIDHVTVLRDSENGQITGHLTLYHDCLKNLQFTDTKMCGLVYGTFPPDELKVDIRLDTVGGIVCDHLPWFKKDRVTQQKQRIGFKHSWSRQMTAKEIAIFEALARDSMTTIQGLCGFSEKSDDISYRRIGLLPPGARRTFYAFHDELLDHVGILLERFWTSVKILSKEKVSDGKFALMSQTTANRGTIRVLNNTDEVTSSFGAKQRQRRPLATLFVSGDRKQSNLNVMLDQNQNGNRLSNFTNSFSPHKKSV